MCPWRLTASVALLFVLGGCERGCLSRWIAERGAPPSPGGATASPDRGLELAGTDCSDGLLRCVGGRIEASRLAHLPHPCGADRSGEAHRAACACPWDPLGRCASGCAVDGLEVLGAPSDAGAAQLCRPDAPVARPLLPDDPAPTEVCAGRSVACVDGIVRTCEAAGRVTRPLAVCLHGCAMAVAIDSTGDTADPGAAARPDGLVAILCQRDQAERR
jgi:hypothetical protein